MLYESGMRPATLVKLQWRHIKHEFLAHRIPMMVKLTSEIMKCRVTERWTFIGQEGVEALKRYLVTRLPLRDDEYVFVGENPKGRKLRSGALSQAFNRTVQSLKMAPNRDGKPKELRLYCLRKAFRKSMAAAIDSRYVEFWMGHTNTETHYLSRDIEHHRKLYAKGYENLRLHKPRINREMVKRIARENRELKRRIVNLEYYKERVDKLEELVDLLLEDAQLTHLIEKVKKRKRYGSTLHK